MATPSDRPCPVCGAREYSHFADEYIDPGKMGAFSFASRKTPEFMRPRLVCCRDCGLVYAPCPPPSGALHQAYAEAAYDSSAEAFCAANTYARVFAPFLQKRHFSGAAVDIGAGNGALLPLLRQIGFTTAIGIEPSRAAIDAAPPDVRPLIREGMFSPEMIADLTPTLIVSCMTLEHVAQPEELAAQAYAALAPGGLFAMVVHNRQAILNRLLGLHSPIIDIEHLQLFHPPSIRWFLHEAGFVDIQTRPFANTYPLRYWLRLLPLPELLRGAVTRSFAWLRLLDKNITIPVGNMAAIGMKPL